MTGGSSGDAPIGSLRATVAAWVGSPNLGDELVYAGLVNRLRLLGALPEAISVDPTGTSAAHGTPARRRRDLVRPGALGDVMVLGGGGLLQDETSTLNLDLHLAPVALARARRVPVAGVGLGAGRLTTRTGQARVRASLRGVDLTVRDEPSADLLASIGLPRPTVAADLALALPAPRSRSSDPEDRIVVCLRPWSGRRHRLPARFRRHGVDDAFAAGAAAALDELAGRTGLAIHLVAFDAPKDDPLHRQVAERMSEPVTTACPGLDGVLAEVANSRAVVAMRFHAGIAAALAGRPAVLVGYGPKVDALDADLGAGAAHLPWSPTGLPGLAGLLEAVLPRADAMAEALAALRTREARNAEALERVLDRAR
jgi:polysaccharide pyruvyl transferase CsaB